MECLLSTFRQLQATFLIACLLVNAPHIQQQSCLDPSEHVIILSLLLAFLSQCEHSFYVAVCMAAKQLHAVLNQQSKTFK